MTISMRRVPASPRRPRTLWPSVEVCPTCYKEDVRGNESVASTVTSTVDKESQWEQHNVFEYHQEAFCFESDSFVCSGFDDTSRDKATRQKHQEAENATAASQDDENWLRPSDGLLPRL